MEPRRLGDSVFSARGFTLIELLIVCSLLGILAAMVVAHLVRAKNAANEASAIASLRALNSAQMAYSGSCGRNFYSPTVARLVAGEFASPDMGLSRKSGFDFALTPGTGVAGGPDCAGQATQTRYYASATPASLSTGRRGFATSTGGAIWQDTSGVAPTEPFAPTADVSVIQ
jgi:type IV pilus assembly protein PilA